MELDLATGAIRVAVCECMDFNSCHIEFGNATPFPVGGCPDGGVCRILGADTDGDGLDDQFLAVCVPLPPPTCCLDISDGLVPFETCLPLDTHTCNGEGGRFHDNAGGCDNVQACCLGSFGPNLCANLNPACCFDSGGIPQGSGSTCTDLSGEITCPQACGGIAGIPCDDPAAFCKFPVGACCCDFMGVCAPRPTGCPDVWDPVCGCDGMTYGNACEADMAGAAINHHGPCGGGACCLSTSAGVIVCVITPREICTAEGGLYQGDGTTCPVDPSVACGTPTGACCHPTPDNTANACSIRTETECVAAGGAYKGNGTECPSDPNLLCGEPLGACCSEVPGIPLPLPFCSNTTREQCVLGGGLFEGAATTCEVTEACCVVFGDQSECLDMNPFCCREFNGAPQGPGTSCLDPTGVLTCPTLCGGVTGIPCPGDNEFCRLPDGGCCCDFLGVCTPIPATCPPILDPVCGCDGVTYGNRCEASAIGVSVDHRGECITGACCLANAAGTVACFITTRQVCHAETGEFQGNGTTCPTDPNTPCAAPTGACCLNDPSTANLAACVETTEEKCGLEGGAYRGDGTACPDDPTQLCPPPQSACCLPDGNCLTLPRDVCVGANGTWNPDLPCELVDCPVVVTGACCLTLADGTTGCSVETPERCARLSGTYLGDNTTCPADGNLPCPLPTGACCVRDPVTATVACEITTVSGCEAASGEYRGDGTVCPDDPALLCDPQESACCFANGNCLNLPIDVCLNEGGSSTPGVPCDLVFCGTSPKGACCVDSLSGPMPPCSVITEAECLNMNGTYLGDNTTCPTDPNQICGLPCDPACPSGLLCFAGCGVLVQGSECVLFRADVGAVFLLGTHGGFAVGDRVRVSGCVDPMCMTTCQEGNGCIAENTISTCARICGGIAGIPCDDPSEFCKFPAGTCTIADNEGLCTPKPAGGCPEIFAPVCGCDRVTYGNECESDAAGVSIAHPGECQTFDCPATRVISDPHVSFCPPSVKTVQIILSPPAGVTAVAVEDTPPGGWSVSEISNNGTFDPVNRKVKWGPFFSGAIPEFVSYVATPSNAAVGPVCFAGTVSLDGLNRPICGDQCIDRRCCPRMAADRPRPACDACPIGDCGSCTGQACGDGQVSLCEMISYACAWMRGCNDDLAGMTRAAFVWRNGECACWGAAAANWFPTSCPGSSTGCCADVIPRDGTLGGVAGVSPVRTGATARVASIRRGTFSAGREVRVPITIEAPPGTSAVALEIEVPRGWQVTSISDEGQWDETNRKVKWGPLVDDLSRTVTFEARRKLVRIRSKAGRTGTAERYTGFSGTISFDGMNQPITVK